MAATTVSQGPEANNVNVDGSVDINDFGGVDTYTILAGLSDNVTITDNSGATINLPDGLSVSNVSFLSNGLQFDVNGFTVTFVGAPETFNYVFGGTPLDPTAGTPLTFSETATAFGTTVPAEGEPANTGNDGTINEDGTVSAPAGAVTVTGTPNPVDEGSTVTFSVDAGTALANQDVTLTLGGDNITTADIVGGSLTVTATTDASGLASIAVDVAADGATEGTETLSAQVTVGTESGSTTVGITDTSTEASFSLSSDISGLVDEGNDITFTITPDTAVANDTTLFVQISGTAVGNVTALASAADFSAVLLQVDFTAGTTAAQTVSVTVLDDGTTEGTEGFAATLVNSAFESIGSETITGVINEAAGTASFTLTTAIDAFTGNNVEGTDGDTFRAPAGTLQTGDDLDGAGGIDVLDVDLAASGSVGPEVDSIGIFNVDFRNEEAALDFNDITGVTALKVEGSTDGGLANLPDNQTIGFVTAGYDEVLNLTFEDTTGTANTVTLDVSNGPSAFDLVLGATAIGTGNTTANTAINTGAGTAAIEKLIVNNSGSNTFLNGIWAINQVSQLEIKGTADVTLNFNSGVLGTADGDGVGISTASTAVTGLFGELSAVMASAFEGNLSLDFIGNNNLNIAGGLGNDTFALNSGLGTTDVIDGGAGTDTVRGAVNGTVTVLPTIRSAENLSLDIDNTGVFNGLNVNGVQNLTLSAAGTAGQTMSLQELPASITAVNLASGATSANLSIDFVTTAAQDVTLNLAGAATATAGLNFSGLQLADSTGGLSVMLATGQVSAIFGALSANNVNALTIDAKDDLSFGVIQASAAKTVTLNVENSIFAGGSGLFGSAGSDGATAFNANITANGGNTTATFSGLRFGTAEANTAGLNTLSISTTEGSAANALFGATGIEANDLLTTVNLSANGGDIALSGLLLNGGTGGAASQGFGVSFNINAVNTSSDIELSNIAFSAATAFTARADFTLQGNGDIDLRGANSAGPFDSAAVAFMASATNGGGTVTLNSLSHSGNLTAVFSATQSAATMSISLGGTGNSLVHAGSGADVIVGGAGQDVIIGGGGADVIDISEGGATSNDVLVYIAQNVSAVAATAQTDVEDGVVDQISGFGTGDTIRLAGVLTGTAAVNFNTAAGSSLTAGAFAALTATAASQLTGGFARLSAISTGATGVGLVNPLQINLFETGGNTILEVFLGTASALNSAVISGDQVLSIQLNGFTASAGQLTATLNSAGLSISFTNVT